MNGSILLNRKRNETEETHSNTRQNKAKYQFCFHHWFFRFRRLLVQVCSGHCCWQFTYKHNVHATHATTKREISNTAAFLCFRFSPLHHTIIKHTQSRKFWSCQCSMPALPPCIYILWQNLKNSSSVSLEEKTYKQFAQDTFYSKC